MKRTAFLAACCLMVAGCYSHSFPTPNLTRFAEPGQQSCAPARPDCLDRNIVAVFADANGTFYPSGWSEHFRPRSPWPRGSLLNETRDGDDRDVAFRRLILEDEDRQLRSLAAFAADGDRVFILVHGYNNTVLDADEAYHEIEPQLDLQPTDRLVRFYWDGLQGSGIGGGKIWFNAVGNSQLVGSRALRRILNQFRGKEVYLIGHSRGSSVILSALGNPVYDPRFLEDTRGVLSTWPDGPADFFTPPPLADNGNALHVLLLAPAIDRIDFCHSRRQPLSPSRFYCPDEDLRPLGEQVRSFRYSVNERDPVLRKFVGLQGHFNPTGLGAEPSTGAQLRAAGLPLQPYRMSPVSEHGFRWYAQQPIFRDMLRDAGILRPAPTS